MKNLRKLVLGACLCLGFVAGAISICPAQWATEPTQLQNHLELLTMYAKQLEQYRTQLLQYELEIRNSLSPVTYIWTQATLTMNQLLGTINTLERLTQQAGSLNAYLNQFQSASYYKNSPCFGPQGCTQQQWAALQTAPMAGSQAQKWANDALVNGIQSQQTQLKQDASNLVQIQNAAQSAAGQMQAIQAANQLAGNQASQLLQIRALLLQEQNATAAKLQTDADKSSRSQAADQQALTGNVNTKDETGLSVQ